MAELEAIANANLFEGVPTRATGTPGHEASVEYVVDVMEAAGFNVTLQPFEADIFFEQAPAAFEQVAPNPIVYPRYDGENGVWYTADFSGDGDVDRRRRGRRLHRADDAGQRVELRLRGRGLRRARRHGQDRAAAARHLRLRPQGRARRRPRAPPPR